MDCAACGGRPAVVGLLCEECRDELPRPPSITPEQISSDITKPAGAALIDVWGRPWQLEARTLFGRQHAAGISILEGSTSRHHAHLARDTATSRWSVRDLGSANGTFVNDQQVTGVAPIGTGDRLTVGNVGFYFIERASELPAVTLDPAAHATFRPEDKRPTVAPRDDFAEPEDTDHGLPELTIAITEPSGGGGGVIEVNGHPAQLSAIQLELFRLLHARMLDEAHQPELVRGFVRSSELLGGLSWDTRDPHDGNIKQLVRRLRKILIKADIGDLIEARHRFGYRLRGIPLR